MLRLYRKPNKGLVGVDISSTTVKLLELSVKNGRYWVESYALMPLPENSVVEKSILNPEAVGDALERVVNLANPHTTNVAIAIPTSMVINKIIEMDADMSDEEREVQIRMDAEQYIPFPLDEVSLDFEVLPDKLPNPNRVNVLLVATRTENVDTRVEVLELANLTAKIAEVESYAMERAFSVFSDTLPMGANTVGILDIGHTMTTLSVMQKVKSFIRVSKYLVVASLPRMCKTATVCHLKKRVGQKKKDRSQMIMTLRFWNLSLMRLCSKLHAHCNFSSHHHNSMKLIIFYWLVVMPIFLA